MLLKMVFQNACIDKYVTKKLKKRWTGLQNRFIWYCDKKANYSSIETAFEDA